MKKFIALSLIAISSIAAAETSEIVFHLGTKHLDSKKKLNEINLGIGVKSDTGLVAGGYYNSYKKISLYAGYQHDFNQYVGAIGYFATGYDGTSKANMHRPLLPVIAATFTLPVTNKNSIRLLVTPMVEGHASVAHIMYTEKF